MIIGSLSEFITLSVFNVASLCSEELILLYGKKGVSQKLVSLNDISAYIVHIISDTSLHFFECLHTLVNATLPVVFMVEARRRGMTEVPMTVYGFTANERGMAFELTPTDSLCWSVVQEPIQRPRSSNPS